MGLLPRHQWAGATFTPAHRISQQSLTLMAPRGATRISFRGGGVRTLGAGPQVLRAPRFSISTASVGPRYLLRVHERRVIRPPGVWLLIEPEATLYICRDILLRLQVQPGCLICNHNACLLSIHNSFRPSSWLMDLRSAWIGAQLNSSRLGALFWARFCSAQLWLGARLGWGW